MQFSSVPLNLSTLAGGKGASANYLEAGKWSSDSAKEASKYLKVNKVNAGEYSDGLETF